MKKEINKNEAGEHQTPPEEQKIIDVKIEDIRVRKVLYPRLKPSEEVIALYSENLEVLPPIVINQDKVLIDGFHRLKAHERHDRTIVPTIKCEVFHTKNDAEILAKAIELNAKQGFHLSYADKRMLAVRLFDGKNSKKLVKILSVSHDCFNKWIREKREVLKQEIENDILDAYLMKGMTQKEIAEEYEVHDTKIAEMKKEILKEINLLFSKKENPSSHLVGKYRAMYIFQPKQSNLWNGIYEGEPSFTYEGGSVGNNLDKDTLFTNLIYHFTEPFDVVCDFTEKSSETCKTWYRRYFPGSEQISKTPKLVIIDSGNEQFKSTVNYVQRKIKNGYVAVITSNFKETFNVINKMNNGKVTLEETIVLPYENSVDNGNKLANGYENLLIFEIKNSN